MKVLAIVVTYNGIQWYHRCFSSLYASTIPLDIFVIDNASTDDTVNFIKTIYSKIILVESKINHGFGQANNKGMKYALDNGYDYVFLLNQDAWIEVDTIEKLINVYKLNTDFGILSPIHLNASNTEIEQSFRHYVTPQWGCPDFTSDLFCKSVKEVYEIGFVNAAAWLISRDCLQKVGYFDAIFYHYGEDDNYLQRVQYHKFKIGIVPDALVVHDTERRVIAKVFIDNEKKKNLLVHFCDIRYDYTRNIFMTIFRFWFSSFTNLLSLKIENAKTNFGYGFFLLKKKKQIISSVKQNRIQL